MYQGCMGEATLEIDKSTWAGIRASPALCEGFEIVYQNYNVLRSELQYCALDSTVKKGSFAACIAKRNENSSAAGVAARCALPVVMPVVMPRRTCQRRLVSSAQAEAPLAKHGLCCLPHVGSLLDTRERPSFAGSDALLPHLPLKQGLVCTSADQSTLRS